MQKIQASNYLKNILTDIRFWILVFFAIRLIGITNEPIEISHNWRQTLTNMIARNFLEDGANLRFPKIDMAGEKTGIIGSEFPFFNYLIYLAFELFGFDHWYGRLINLTISSIGIYYFYKTIKELINPKIAFNATIILLSSIWFAFSRKIMPDTFSISLLFIGLFHGYQYLKNKSITGLLLFFLFSTLGMLCKIPALSVFSVLAVTLFIKEIPMPRKILFYSVSSLSFAIVCLWYFYWVPYLLDVYQYQLYFPKTFSEGLAEILHFIPQLLEKFYFSSLSSYIATGCFIGGIYVLIKSKDNLVKSAILIVSIVFILFIIKTGAVFPLHNYYIIPYTPFMAIIAAYLISSLSQKYAYLLLVIISVEAIANQQHDFFIKDKTTYILSLEQLTNQYIPKENLIIINGEFSPQDIYFTNRKGWTILNKQLKNELFVDSLRNLGANYIIINKHNANNTELNYKQVFSNSDFVFYKLSN